MFEQYSRIELQTNIATARRNSTTHTFKTDMPKIDKKKVLFFLMSPFSMISPLYNKRIGLNDGPSPIALYVLAIKDPKSAIASTGFF